MAAFAMGPEDRGPWYGDKACERGGRIRHFETENLLRSRESEF